MNTLPAKYSKFATFAFWFLGHLKESEMVSEDAYATISKGLTDGHIPNQVTFYEKFLAECDSVSKLFKSLNKKPKMNKKNKKDSSSQDQEGRHAQTEQQLGEKKPKKNKKTNNNNNPNIDIISQIVLRANSVQEDDLIIHSDKKGVTPILQKSPDLQKIISEYVPPTDSQNEYCGIQSQQDNVKQTGKGKPKKDKKECVEKKDKQNKPKKEKKECVERKEENVEREEENVENVENVERKEENVECVEKKEKQNKLKKEKKIKEEDKDKDKQQQPKKEKKSKKLVIVQHTIIEEQHPLSQTESLETISESGEEDNVDVSETTTNNNLALDTDLSDIINTFGNLDISLQDNNLSNKVSKIKNNKEKKEKKEKKENKDSKEKKEKKEQKEKEKEKKEKKPKQLIQKPNDLIRETQTDNLYQEEEPESVQDNLYQERQHEMEIEQQPDQEELEEEPDQEEQDIDLFVVMIDDVEYYYDNENNLYDNNQTIVGTFDPSTKDISYF
jgi:hypothetical protein